MSERSTCNPISCFDPLRQNLNLACRGLMWLTFGLWAGTALAQSEPVGNVSLVLGSAFLQSADHGRREAHVGDPVHVGDSVVTQANGHVHVRFVDAALVSVRPLSHLEVLRYDYDPARPEQSAVKFNLLEGVTRAISGNAAHKARERFRLNTPIAAIGVRGTDFVVRADGESVRAVVNQGAIVMAPFSVECAQDALGPCVANAVELSDSSLQIVELDGTNGQPRVLTATLEREPELVQQEINNLLAVVDPAVPAVDDKAAETEVYLENVTSRQVVTTQVEAIRPTVAAARDFTPAASLTLASAANRDLVWGRWGNGLDTLERITLPAAQAALEREVAVGNTRYTLFREEAGVTTVDRGLGPVAFNLDSAQAFYDAGSGAMAMQVRGGNLTIDFDTSTFATRLDLNHSLTGAVDIVAAGRLLDGGFFNSRTDQQSVVGAVSQDGREAGYFFEKQLETGGIHGLTLWDRP